MFLSLWVRLEELTKLCQFVTGLTASRIHPKYTVMVRTGRTSCSGPNIQQLPRAVGFREIIVPTKDHVFLTIDYSAIELRTLAAVCERRFGQSRLADVIREGADPHAFTAAMFEGISLERFNEHPDRKMLRQRAKALNFGIPGGLGAKALVAYAAATYGVTLSVDQAATFRDRLIQEVYPELKQYLQSDSIAALAASLQTSPIRVQHHFATDGTVGAIRRVIAGLGRADNGGQYGEAFVNQIWRSLGELNENPRYSDSFAKREISEQLADDLFMGPVVTATGRVRGRVGYSQSKNTPFQGLAADGAKLAMWRLYLAGFRTVAFVHDEMLIELPVTADHTELARQVAQILCEAMGELTGDVPIACEYALADRWSKNAERVVDSDGRLQLWQPQ
jgi:DNA polymerase I-like protein with 3'-5' exonuclease and polymerase domains